MNNKYLDRLFQDSCIVELRHNLDGRRWESGLFSDSDAFRREVMRREHLGALYSSLNRPHKDRVVPNSMGSRPLCNDDIETVTRLPFDFDPQRPTGVSSTALELAAALRCRDAVVGALSAYGWPMPALAISGNGAHAVYRINVKPTADWTKCVAILYCGVRNLFSELLAAEGVKFDTAVRNPGRIWRLYGSVNRKGDATPERPHRMAACTLPAGKWDTVPVKVLERFIQQHQPAVVHERRVETARRYANAPRGKGDYRTLDVVAWFQQHGAYRKPVGPGVHGVICPWSVEHSTGRPTPSETVIFDARADRWPGFHCHHSHCDGRTLRDVLALWPDADAFCSREWQGGSRGR